jgi:hypothetical protein
MLAGREGLTFVSALSIKAGTRDGAIVGIRILTQRGRSEDVKVPVVTIVDLPAEPSTTLSTSSYYTVR